VEGEPDKKHDKRYWNSGSWLPRRLALRGRKKEGRQGHQGDD